MRTKRAALAACAAACACAGGPALAAALGERPANRIPAGETAPLTRTFTTTTTTIGTTSTQTTTAQTTTTQTDTSTAPKTAPVPKLSVCLRNARAVIARALGVRVAAVRRTQRAGSNGMPQCNYLVRRARTVGPHTRAVVVVNVDNGAQAAWRLMRKVVEADQIFGVPPPGWKAPIGLNGLGPYASWFPNLDQLMANNVDRRYIFTVSVVWWRAKRAEMISLARAAVVPYRRVRRFAA